MNVEASLAEIFSNAGVEGCIVLQSDGDETPTVFNPGRAGKRFRPASTFKIMNALIALEIGAIHPKESLDWDGTPVWCDAQKQSFQLEGAFRASAVWFFRILARRIGPAHYREVLRACNYGNGECGSEVESFWLRGPLEISPLEQIHFLRKLRAGELPFSPGNVALVERIMKLESKLNGTLHGKTGFLDEGPAYGWFVGFLDGEQSTTYFATHIDIPEERLLQRRIEVTEQCLASFLSPEASASHRSSVIGLRQQSQ